MIILRTKNYSSKFMQMTKGVKRIGNSTMTMIDNAGLKAGDTVRRVITGQQAHPYRFVPKTNMQLNRETVSQVRGAQKAIQATPGVIKDAAKQAPGMLKQAAKEAPGNAKKAIREAPGKIKKTAKEIYYTPGEVLDKGIKFTAENPIAAAGQAGSVVLPAVNPIFLGIPVGSPSLAVNGAAKKWVRPYAERTARIGEAYGRSNLSKGLRSLPSLPVAAGQLGQMVAL